MKASIGVTDAAERSCRRAVSACRLMATTPTIQASDPSGGDSPCPHKLNRVEVDGHDRSIVCARPCRTGRVTDCGGAPSAQPRRPSASYRRSLTKVVLRSASWST